MTSVRVKTAVCTIVLNTTGSITPKATVSCARRPSFILQIGLVSSTQGIKGLESPLSPLLGFISRNRVTFLA